MVKLSKMGGVGGAASAPGRELMLRYTIALAVMSRTFATRSYGLYGERISGLNKFAEQDWADNNVNTTLKENINEAFTEMMNRHRDSVVRSNQKKLVNLNGGQIKHQPTKDDIDHLARRGKVTVSPTFKQEITAEAYKTRGSYNSEIIEKRHIEAAKQLKKHDTTYEDAAGAMFVLGDKDDADAPYVKSLNKLSIFFVTAKSLQQLPLKWRRVFILMMADKTTDASLFRSFVLTLVIWEKIRSTIALLRVRNTPYSSAQGLKRRSTLPEEPSSIPVIKLVTITSVAVQRNERMIRCLLFEHTSCVAVHRRSRSPKEHCDYHRHQLRGPLSRNLRTTTGPLKTSVTQPEQTQLTPASWNM
ncbi:hypothetical protein Pcinc_011251 [Petrolisthes cinctipes]|uniref:Uncharacterized protein n=1 Tax=Petrolisthes cinctipes TaxID=88211 RepID=A0AAE1KUL9_PETCI|nr:hypothetical protein Pcinc_011251 [Petrolisthes cinctipes]